MSGRLVCLLGPQRFSPTVAAALRDLGIDGSIAAVTAGWQERETEDAELREHVARDVVNLRLYARGEDVFKRDRSLFRAIRSRQDRLRALQEVYHSRLSHGMDAAREILSRPGDPWLLEPERSDAVEAVRRLDAHHTARLAEVHAAFEAEVRPFDRDGVARHRAELASILSNASVIAIAGGHVAVLANRLRLFGLLELAPRLPVLAWSAGGMAISGRVVLFHDSPPQGVGNAEVFDVGLGAFASVVPLPHASKRLRLDDPMRIALLARRFAPDIAVALDGPARLVCRAGRWSAGPQTRRLHPDGHLREIAAR